MPTEFRVSRVIRVQPEISDRKVLKDPQERMEFKVSRAIRAQQEM